MRLITKVAIASTITAAVLFTSGTAHATTMDEAITVLGDISAATANASRQRSPATMMAACVGVEDAAMDFLALTKPKAMPSAVWRHTRRAATYSYRSAIACQDANFTVAAGYAQRATTEFDASTAAIARYLD